MIEQNLRPADIIEKFLAVDADGDGQMNFEEVQGRAKALRASAAAGVRVGLGGGRDDTQGERAVREL